MILLDYVIVVCVLIALLIVSLYFRRKASSDTEEFILGGRKVPWWLAAISTVATGININTPLADGRKMRADGIGGLWFNWQNAIGNLFSVAWLNLLWKRSGVSTPLEIYAIRYGSRSARVARFCDATLISVINSVLWSCGGLVAFKKLAVVIFGLPPVMNILGQEVATGSVVLISGVLLAWVFSSLAGVYSIVWSDLAEAVLVVGCTYFMFFRAYAAVGWAPGLRASVESLGAHGDRILTMLPEVGPAMVVLLLVQPIVTQGQWSPVTQRVLCVATERDVLKTGFISQFIHWVIRPWPFFILGLCGIFLISDKELLALFPGMIAPNGQEIPDYEMAFPALAGRLLPPGLLGLLMAGFAVSFISSLSSNIHSNAAAFLNDLYRPFVNQSASETRRLWVTRWFMAAQMVVASALALYWDNVLGLAMLAFSVNCSSGIVKGLRFFWWRVNGQAELVSILVGALSLIIWFSTWGDETVIQLGRLLGQQSNDAYYALRFLLIVGASSAAGLLTALFTKPESSDVLDAFYRKTRPHGAWGPVRERNLDCLPPIGARFLVALTAAGIGLVFGGIFAAVGLLLYYPLLATIAGIICALCAWYLRNAVNRMAPQ